MTDRLRILGLALLLAPAGAVLGYDFQYPRATVDMELKQVSEHVYYAQGVAGIPTENQGFVSNMAAVVTEEGIVTFDALGSPALAELFLSELRRISQAPIRYAVVSHYHADHIYGLQVLKDAGATVLAPRGAYEYLDSPGSEERLKERRLSLSPWVNERTRLVDPDELIEGTRVIELGGVTITLNYLGSAHADGDLSAFVEPDGVLLSGDVIFEGRVPFVGDANTKVWLEALRDMERIDLQALIPGHGPLADDPNEAIRLTRTYLEFLREKMGAAVDELKGFDQAYAEVDWSEFSDLPAFEAANRRNAYQVYLSMEAELLGN
jgi:glyoxylase-like metal-dependent hydrolase (beta-lactamase superfamily II)